VIYLRSVKIRSPALRRVGAVLPVSTRQQRSVVQPSGHPMDEHGWRVIRGLEEPIESRIARA